MPVLGSIATAFAALMGVDKGAEIVGAAVNMLTDGAGKKALEWVETRVRAYTHGIPPNHDLEHALRLAELTTSLVMVETYRGEEDAEQVILRSAKEPPFIAAARSWLHGQIGLSFDLKLTPNNALVEALEHELDRVLVEHDVAALRGTLASVETQVWNDLCANATKNGGGVVPEDFRDLFFGRSVAGRPGWSIVFQAFVREALKDHPRAQVAFITTRLASLRTVHARLEAKLDLLIAGQHTLLVGQARTELLLEEAREAARGRYGVAEGFIQEMALRVGADPHLDLDGMKRTVRNAVEIYAQEIAGGLAQTTVGEIVERALLNAKRLADEGKSRLARAALRKTADTLGREEEERRAAFAQRIKALFDYERNIALAAYDGEAAAEAIVSMAELFLGGEAPARRELLIVESNELYEFGVRRGSNVHLIAAVSVRAATLRLGRTSGEIGFDRLNLGNALWSLGERESGTARLEEAVTAYRAALEERTRERVPLDWAMTQNNVGNALSCLGERESGTARLEEAVTAYRAALKERTRGRVPLDWAMTQNNVGNALSCLGERESGTARLEEAVTAYRAALKERTRGRVPLDWAMTQTNLGTALRTLGQRESGTARLEEAVITYRAGLEECTQERAPLQWASTQIGLGNALLSLGARGSGTDRLEEAVGAYRAVLEEYTRERAPLQWAATQNNLGLALRTLGEREGGTARLEEAVGACRAALEEFTESKAYFYVSAPGRGLDEVQALLAKRNNFN